MCQGSVTYGWDAAGRRSTLTVEGQPQISYGYDAADRLTTITQDTSQVGFSYDDAGRRATLTLPNGVVASYSYDNANQLTGISYAQGTTTLGDLTYVYDDAGRRIQMGGSLARTNLPPALASATYDAANRLTNWAGTNQTYDLNGNLTGDGAKTYTWNSRNRLTSLSGAASASFQYDGLGRRTGKTVFGTTTNFLYDGLNPVQELTGTTPKANLITGLGVDEYFARTDSAGTRSFVTDALGSTLALTDGAGDIQTSYTYTPYGETTVSGAASGNALQYTGRENDGTGLYFYRARYYDQVKSRFVSEDPIGLAGGINIYSYVDDNPLSYVDPEGLFITASLNEFAKPAYHIPTREAIRISNFSSLVGVSGALIAASGPLVGAVAPEIGPLACRVAPALKDPCRNAIIAMALGTAVCQGKLPNSIPRDLERKEVIRRGSELSGQKKIGNQQQYP